VWRSAVFGLLTCGRAVVAAAGTLWVGRIAWRSTRVDRTAATRNPAFVCTCGLQTCPNFGVRVPWRTAAGRSAGVPGAVESARQGGTLSARTSLSSDFLWRAIILSTSGLEAVQPVRAPGGCDPSAQASCVSLPRWVRSPPAAQTAIRRARVRQARSDAVRAGDPVPGR
jgi:hypothetical protein